MIDDLSALLHLVRAFMAQRWKDDSGSDWFKLDEGGICEPRGKYLRAV